jgi:hypothetical protein
MQLAGFLVRALDGEGSVLVTLDAVDVGRLESIL